MRQIGRVWIVLVSLGLLLVGCGERGFDREALLQGIVDEIILPNHARFSEKSADLEIAVRTLYVDPSQANLADAQDAWKAAVEAWSAVQLFNMGPIDRDFLHPSIDRVPPNIDGVEQAMHAGETISMATVNNFGSNKKGLPVLEYLLFVPDLSDQQRLDYTLATAEVLAQSASSLETAWRAYARDFVSAELDNQNTNSSISMLVNEMVRQLEYVMGFGLGRPLGLTSESNGVPHPEDVLSPYAGYTEERLVQQLVTVQTVFDAGIDDYLDYLNLTPEGEQPLSERFKTEIAAAIVQTQQLDDLAGMVVQDRESAEATYTAVREVAILARVEMTSQLGVLLTFSDADGD
jgi:predicted lipoprotein